MFLNITLFYRYVDKYLIYQWCLIWLCIFYYVCSESLSFMNWKTFCCVITGVDLLSLGLKCELKIKNLSYSNAGCRYLMIWQRCCHIRWLYCIPKCVISVLCYLYGEIGSRLFYFITKTFLFSIFIIVNISCFFLLQKTSLCKNYFELNRSNTKRFLNKFLTY